MYSKIIIAEDFDTISIGLDIILKKLQGVEIAHAKDCDHALLKIRKALEEGSPFDLLVTDLSFMPGHCTPKIAGGEALIREARKVQPSLDIIVHSVESRLQKIRNLFEVDGINGYVAKGRNGEADLLKAIDKISKGALFVQPEFNQVLHPTGVFEISDEDIALLKLISEGFTIKEAGEKLRALGQTAVSHSSVEKRINNLRVFFNANNSIHLVSMAKDMGLI